MRAQLLLCSPLLQHTTHRHTRSKLVHVLAVSCRFPDGLPLLPPGAHLAVGQTCLFRVRQRLGFNEQSLPLIPFPCTTLLQHHGRQGGMLAGASGQRSITGRQKKQMLQVSARQTQGPFLPGKRDPHLCTKRLPTLAAGRDAIRDEYREFCIRCTLRLHHLLRMSRDAAGLYCAVVPLLESAKSLCLPQIGHD